MDINNGNSPSVDKLDIQLPTLSLLSLYQSATSPKNDASLQCTGKTPYADSKPNLIVPQRHGTQESPLSIESAATAVRGQTPMTSDIDLTLPSEEYLITPSDSNSELKQSDEFSDVSNGSNRSDDDDENYSSDESSSDLPFGTLLSMISDAEEDTVFCRKWVQKSAQNM